MTDKEIHELIQNEINTYVEKYSICNHISKEEARKHAMVQITEHYYERGQNK